MDDTLNNLKTSAPLPSEEKTGVEPKRRDEDVLRQFVRAHRGCKIKGTVFEEYRGEETFIEIPEGVTVIGVNAFANCSSLTSVVIPDSVEEIEFGAFCGCIALKEWSISSEHPYFKTDGTGLLTKNGKILVACLGSAKKYQIPEGVTEINFSAFSGCSFLTSVEIPESVTKIGGLAFSGCSSLTSVVIPEGVKEIGYRAFSGCNSLTSVGIPDSEIFISGDAFAYCTALKEWPISSTHPYFKSDGAGLLTKDGKRLIACIASAKEYRIPEGVEEIGNGAFHGCRSLTSVVIPESVTLIRGGAFEDCSSLTSVEIPKSVKEIKSMAFWDCSSLTSVVIPRSVKKIESYEFRGCPKLKIKTPIFSYAWWHLIFLKWFRFFFYIAVAVAFGLSCPKLFFTLVGIVISIFLLLIIVMATPKVDH